MLKAEKIVFSYSNIEKAILKNISFELNKKDILTILGPNGAGKSTLINCFSGNLIPQSGEISINGQSIRGFSPKQLAKHIGYVRQTIPNDIMFPVKEYVSMGCAPHVSAFKRPGKEQMEKVEWAIEYMGISHLSSKPMSDISGGERQQAAIARVLVQDPEIILFDEPTAHLDFSNQLKALQIIASLADKGYIIIFTTHNPEHALLLDGKTGVLDKNGNFILGATKEILTGEFLSKVYGADLVMADIVGYSDRKVCITRDVIRNRECG